ncbi:MAG: HU family DNA-binding protein [Acidimicrobiia bacterium]|nr:HU family DNA-binding protein [Acidimicrobiia bacterium]
MNKSELVAEIAERTGQSKSDVDASLGALCDVMEDVVAKGGGKISVSGYFSVERTNRAARMGRNPQTGATIHIAASKGIKMSAGAKLKNAAKNA